MLKLHWLPVLLGLLVGCATSSVAPPANAPAGKASLRLLSSRWPPFVDAADKPQIAVDLVASALQRAGYRPIFEVDSLEAVIEALRAETYDGSAALWRSEEREQSLLYSDTYLENRLMLVGAKGSAVDAASFAELAGKKVGIVEGYAYGPQLDDAKEPVFVRGASTEENLRALLHGELDYVLCDALVIHHLVQAYPEQARDKLALGSQALLTRTLHFVVRKNVPGAQNIIDSFNHELDRMLTDGTYHRLLGVQWIEADVDGDGVLELVAAGESVGRDPPRNGYSLVSVTRRGSDELPSGARFVIKGVPYDTWLAVPEEYKKTENPLGAKPTTLRVSIFEF